MGHGYCHGYGHGHCHVYGHVCGCCIVIVAVSFIIMCVSACWSSVKQVWPKSQLQEMLKETEGDMAPMQIRLQMEDTRNHTVPEI